MQGDVLTPFLFIIVMDYVIKRAARNHGFFTHPRRSSRYPQITLNELGFADDIANLENDMNGAQLQLNDLDTEGQIVGLGINIPKTVFSTYNIDATTPLTINDVPLKQTDNFRYLGSMSKDSTADMERRRGMALGAFWKLKPIWDSTDIILELFINLFIWL